MLNLVRNFIAADVWRPSRRQPYIDRAYLARIHVGSLIGFGPLPQFILSEKRLEVTAVKTYRFADARYVSFELSSDKKPVVSLIVAESEGDQYLVISRKVSPEEQLRIFQGQDMADYTAKPAPAELRCKHGVRGFRGWVDYVYQKMLEGVAGAVYPGNLMGKPVPDAAAQEFDYFLYVSPDEEHAIEIEKYKNGQVDVYTTIYRPVSDIVSISIPRRPRLVVQRKAAQLESGTEVKTAEVKTLVQEKPQPEVAITKLPVEGMETSTPQAQESITHNAIVGCNVKVAGRIIEEAVKNGITLSHLVRKVVGLPMEVKEEVFFSLPLSEADYQALAARYALPADAHDAIHAKVMEEIAGFAGIRA